MTDHHPVPVRVLMMLAMNDGSNYGVLLTPSAPAGVAAIRFVELQTQEGVPIGRWPLYDHGRGLHTMCDLEVVES